MTQTDAQKQQLLELAQQLDTARLLANSIDSAAWQLGVYGDISDALNKTLVLLLGNGPAELAYQSLLDCGSLADALAYAAAHAEQARTEYLAQFDNDALAAMAGSGYWNSSTGLEETATLEEVQAVFNYRAERDNDWAAEQAAEQLAEELADVHTDTVSVGLYTLEVNGRDSEYGQYVTRYGIAYAVARELLAAGIDPEFNTGIIAAVLEQLDSGQQSSIIAGGLETGPEFSVRFVANS